MGNMNWDEKWKALLERAQKIQYTENEGWSLTATGASASCSFASLGLTGLTISATALSLSFTAVSVSFTGLWGQLVGQKLKSHNGRSNLEAQKLRARIAVTDGTINDAVTFLQQKGIGVLEDILSGSRLE